MLIPILSFDIQLSEGKCLYPINRFKPATFLCMSRVETWISNAMHIVVSFVFTC